MKKQPKLWGRAAKVGISIVLICLAGYALLVYLGRTVRGLEYFKIKDIISKEPIADDFAYLKGRNIFALDLKKEAAQISVLYPTYKKVRLIRILPAQLFVDFVKRHPLAYIKLYKYFYVDQESILLEATVAPEDADLPVIVGLETKVFGAKPGKAYAVPELTAALDIITKAAAHEVFRDFKIKRIDAKALDDVAFYIPVVVKDAQGKIGDSELEVRFGDESIEQKMEVLSGLLTQLRTEVSNIKYIDLRFKEPLIKFKEKIANAQ